MNPKDKMKDVELEDGEEITEETVDELTDNRGEEDE